MNLRVGNALLLAALLAGCADLSQYTGASYSGSTMAAPEARAPLNADPTFRMSELRVGLTKAQLEAMYPGRLAFDSRDARNALYFVEPLGVTPDTSVPRNRLVLWLNDGKLATFEVVQSTEPFAVASVPEGMTAAAAGPAMPPRQSRGAQPHGKYGVQLAAVQSEAEARALIDTMRSKYPDQLAQQWATITRVSLPQGVFFRVVIGPIASERQASQLCSSLRAQGAECLIRGV